MRSNLLRLFIFCLGLAPTILVGQEASVDPGDLADVMVFIPIKGEITARSCNRVWRDTEAVLAKNCKKIAYQIDTDGGDYRAAYELARKIYDIRERADTFAYLENGARAISAGALIAFSCEDLVIGDNVRIGDVAPVDYFGKPLPEKIQTVVRADLKRYAEAHPGWPIPIILAMVTKELEVFEVIDRNSTGARKEYVLGSDLEHRPDADRLEKRIVIPAGQLATLNDTEILEYGMVTKIYPTRNQFIEDYGITAFPSDVEAALGRSIDLSRNRVVSTLNDNPFPKWVKFLLILFGVVGLAVEFKLPGTFIGGSVFLVCFVAFFVEAFATQHAGWIEVLCFPAAIALIVVEMFVIPGFGVAGILGLGLLLMSLALALVPDEGALNWGTFNNELFTIVLALSGSGAVVLLMLRFLPGGKATQRGGLISTTTLNGDSLVQESGADPNETTESLLGRKGVVRSALRPAGKIILNGEQRPRDVVAIGAFVPAGTPVSIVKIEGNRVIVEPDEHESET